MPAGDVEGGEVLLLVEEGEHADADAAGDDEEQGFRKRLAGERIAHAGMAEESAQGRGGGDVARKMPRERRIGRRGGLWLLIENVATGGGVAFARLLHARTDALFEVFVHRHC